MLLCLSVTAAQVNYAEHVIYTLLLQDQVHFRTYRVHQLLVHDLTVVAGLQNFLTSIGRADSDTAAIANGFKQGLQKENLATLNFAEFLQCYQWLLKTLHLMEHSQEGFELPRANSMRGLSASSSLIEANPQQPAQNGS